MGEKVISERWAGEKAMCFSPQINTISILVTFFQVLFILHIFLNI
jgi:hypothetical protein